MIVEGIEVGLTIDEVDLILGLGLDPMIVEGGLIPGVIPTIGEEDLILGLDLDHMIVVRDLGADQVAMIAIGGKKFDKLKL